MKKTITVNIGGYAFTIEEDAYQSLLTYLKTIESFFQIEEGGDEILSDIEARIAELFNERLGKGRQVVEEADVKEIKLIMGEPEQYAPYSEDASEQSTESFDENKYERSKNRKFYRDLEDQVIGGVCSGLSHYLGWDPIWLRGIFIALVLAGFAGIPLYLILWLLIPSAKTTAEKLKMKGRKINVENISKSIKDEMEGVKSSFQKMGSKAEAETERLRKKSIPRFLDSLGATGGALLKVLRVIIGIILLILGFSLVIGLVGGLVTFNSTQPFGDSLSYSFLEDFIFIDGNILGMATVSVVLLIIVPLIAVMYLGIKLLTRVKTQGKGIGLTMFGLFFVGIILAIVAGVTQGTRYNQNAEISETSNFSSGELIHVEILNDPYFNNKLKLHDSNNTELMRLDDDMIVYGFPKFRLRSTSQPDPRIEIVKQASGSNYSEALEITEDIVYDFQIEGDTLKLSPFFMCDSKHKYRDHELIANLYVPDSSSVQLDENMERMVNRWKGDHGKYMSNYSGHQIMVLKDEMICKDCEDSQ